MSDTYTIRRPFRLVDHWKLHHEGADGIGTICGYPAELTKPGPQYLLKVSNVPSSVDAARLLQQITTGLRWAAVEWKMGVEMRTRVDTPSPVGEGFRAQMREIGAPWADTVDALVDGSVASLHPDSMHIRQLIGQDVGLVISGKATRLFPMVEQGATLAHAAAIAEGGPLKAAIELYCDSLFLQSERARFLFIWTVLEALTPTPELAAVTSSWVDRWRDEATAALDGMAPSDREELRALVQRLGALKRQSHRSRLRVFVSGVLTRDGHAEAAKMAADVTSLYDQRGRMVHDGTMAPSSDVSRLDEICRAVLKAAMRQGVGLDLHHEAQATT